MRMIVEFGLGLLVISFIVALYGCGAAIMGALTRKSSWIESARRSLILTTVAITLVILSLLVLILGQQYDVSFVVQNSTSTMSALQKIGILWTVPDGILLISAWLTSIFFAFAINRSPKSAALSTGWFMAVGIITLLFFLTLSIFLSNPFTRIWRTSNQQLLQSLFQPANATPNNPPEGNGNNPLASSPGWIFQSGIFIPALFSLTIPFAFTISACLNHFSIKSQIKQIRPWLEFSWITLSLTLVFEFQRVYSLLGRGNIWTWESFEVAILIPWVLISILLHTTQYNSDSPFKERLNWILLFATLPIIFFSSSLTQKSLMVYDTTSVASSQNSLIVFASIWLSIAILLLALNWKHLVPPKSQVPASEIPSTRPAHFQRWRLKEMADGIWKPFTLSLLLAGLFWAIGIKNWLTLVSTWLFIFIILIHGFRIFLDILAYQTKMHSNLKHSIAATLQINSVKYGNGLAHLGVVMIALSIIGFEVFQSTTLGILHPSESLSIGSYQLTLQSISTWDTNDNRNIVRADLSVTENGTALVDSYPRRDYYYPSQQTLTIPAIQKTIDNNLYILLIGWQTGADPSATFKIYSFPLVNWLWIGSILMAAGFFIFFWREHHPLSESDSAPERSDTILLPAEKN